MLECFNVNDNVAFSTLDEDEELEEEELEELLDEDVPFEDELLDGTAVLPATTSLEELVVFDELEEASAVGLRRLRMSSQLVKERTQQAEISKTSRLFFMGVPSTN